MKLEKWALIAEIVSAVAIVLSLIFVGLQVRQGTQATANNSRALEAAVRESMLNADLSILQSLLPYNVVGRFESPTTEEEIAQQTTYSFMLMRTRENYWKQHANGMLDEESYLSYREILIRFLTNSDFHLNVWSVNSANFVPRFVSEINDQLVRNGRLPRIEQDAD